MPATVVLGGQWGDEGKGKITDALAGTAQMVVRANGGSNAGHTISAPSGLFKMHLVPSGILNPDCVCVIGAGVVIDPMALDEELQSLQAQGVDTSKLVISDRAHLVLPYHAEIDREEEKSRELNAIGTTLKGIGPAYSDKYSRQGLRMADLADTTNRADILQNAFGKKNDLLSRYYDSPPVSAKGAVEALEHAGERLSTYIGNAEIIVQDALDGGQQVVVECAQGAMLDIDYGTYPYVTSSSPTTAGACQGAGVAPGQVERVIGVFKAYSSRVGAGPMPTELADATGNLLRERGREYGTTTGRPRRVGWFDAVAARRTVRLNGVTEIALTLLDVLDGFDQIRICTGYQLDGQQTLQIPVRASDYFSVLPVYELVDGWPIDTTSVRVPGDLPEQARAYINRLEALTLAPISMVGIGPDREQLIAMGSVAALST